MAKKTFKDNPALQFISAPQEAPEQEQREAEALTIGKAPEGYKINPVYVEVKSRRLQLVLQPSLYDKIKARAGEAGISVNEFCHKALEEVIAKENTKND